MSTRDTNTFESVFCSCWRHAGAATRTTLQQNRTCGAARLRSRRMRDCRGSHLPDQRFPARPAWSDKKFKQQRFLKTSTHFSPVCHQVELPLWSIRFNSATSTWALIHRSLPDHSLLIVKYLLISSRFCHRCCEEEVLSFSSHHMSCLGIQGLRS